MICCIFRMSPEYRSVDALMPGPQRILALTTIGVQLHHWNDRLALPIIQGH